jgi:RNA polymerase sigma-70 factor (ECF subfamily)
LRDLFIAEEGRLLRYAFGLVGRREIAEDIVQEAFLQLHAHWDQVREPLPWLYRSVRNRSANHHRDHRREVLGDAPAEPQEGREAPDEALRKLEAEGQLRLVVAELEPPDQELLRLKYGEDLKYREIAERTGLSTGNVGYRLHHILKLLAAKLHQLGIDGVN